MLARATRGLLVFVSLASIDCGQNEKAGPDGFSSDGDASSCTGDAISCVHGAPAGTGVACNGTVVPGTCASGQWTCPNGTVNQRDCTCGEPGLSCMPQICTSNGPVCLDAGADADAGVDVDGDTAHDGPTDGRTCVGDAPDLCAQGNQVGDAVACSEELTPAVCVNGLWTCTGPPFSVDIRTCTCVSPAPSGCATCTMRGWVSCNDGGTEAASDERP